MDEIGQILKERKRNFIPLALEEKTGILKIYTKLATSAMKGGYLDIWE